MPEGPEVRTVADKLNFLIDYEITAVYVDVPKYIDGKIETPCVLREVYSFGKKLIFRMEKYDGDFQYLIFSLGMTGRIQYEPDIHSKVSLEFNGFMLYFVDSRGFGGLEIRDTKGYNKIINKLGPDILSEEVDSETWFKIFEKKKRAKIEAVLLDQSVISGIGNYLKSEILYFSGILPNRLVGTLSQEELENLRYHSHRIIRLSYSFGGFTIKDFISPDGSLGKYKPAVYNQLYDPENNEVKKTGSQRNTFYVLEKQK